MSFSTQGEEEVKGPGDTLILFLSFLFLSLSHSPVPVLSFLIIVSTLKLGLLLARLLVLQGRPHGSNNTGSMGVCVCMCAGGNPPHLGRRLRVKGGLKCA